MVSGARSLKLCIYPNNPDHRTLRSYKKIIYPRSEQTRHFDYYVYFYDQETKKPTHCLGQKGLRVNLGMQMHGGHSNIWLTIPHRVVTDAKKRIQERVNGTKRD